MKVEEDRRFRRVPVHLKGALRMPRRGAILVETTNVSEGGVCLRRWYTGAQPSIGTEVHLNLQGVISNYDDERLHMYLMRVVHVSDTGVGLAFV